MEQDSRICEICHNHIFAKCFDIHKRACQRRNKNHKEAQKVKLECVDLIPCSECGEMVSFQVYGEHIQECVGHQLTKCHQCKLLYPTFLIQEHLAVCVTFNQEEQKPQKNIAEVFNFDDSDQQMEQMIMELAAKGYDQDNPLTIVQINTIPKTNTTKIEQCSICYCDIPEKTQTLRLPCPHLFHIRCISAWLQKNAHCPMCRRFTLT